MFILLLLFLILLLVCSVFFIPLLCLPGEFFHSLLQYTNRFSFCSYCAFNPFPSSLFQTIVFLIPTTSYWFFFITVFLYLISKSLPFKDIIRLTLYSCSVHSVCSGWSYFVCCFSNPVLTHLRGLIFFLCPSLLLPAIFSCIG